jgi:hypothetical protein
VIVIDEYLALRVLAGTPPKGLVYEELGITAYRHWRLLQRVHSPGTGQLSRLLAALSPTDRDVVRHPDPAVVQIRDPRSLLDDAAAISARSVVRGCSWPRPWLLVWRTAASCGSGRSGTGPRPADRGGGPWRRSSPGRLIPCGPAPAGPRRDADLVSIERSSPSPDLPQRKNPVWVGIAVPGTAPDLGW